MNHTYKVKVNDDFVEAFDKAEIDQLDALEYAPDCYHILNNQQSYKGEITQKDFLKRHYQVRINATTYSVDIANDLDRLIAEMGLALKAAQKEDKINAPMPGLILEINTKEGQEVSEGDYLIVLEAMKMENALAAPKDGVIKSIAVKQGESVDKGQLLIEFE